MFERLPALEPIHFFDLTIDGFYLKDKFLFQKKHLLPNPFKEEDHPLVYFGFNENGIFFSFHVFSEVKEVFFPDFRKGDCIELFIDTRNLKSAGYVTKFCHHFVVFPMKIDDFYIQEVTRFRSDDTHVLSLAKDFEVQTEAKKDSYKINLFIPAFCLYGFDIEKFQRLGFTFRVNRMGKESQNFSLSPKEFVIERNPYFWSNLILKKE